MTCLCRKSVKKYKFISQSEMKIVHLSLTKVFHRRKVLYKTMKETWLKELGVRRWKIHFPPFTLPSSSLKIIISISKACNQTREKRKEKFAKQQKEVNEEVENPAGNFQLFTIFRVHFTLLSERTKEFFSLFLINYGNYSGCLHYAPGEWRPSCYAATYGMWLFTRSLTVKKCLLAWMNIMLCSLDVHR